MVTGPLIRILISNYDFLIYFSKSDTLLSQQEITLAETVEHSEDDEEEELRRYGFWSCEAQSLGLPSYRAAFLFLSRIPLEMIHEFLRMRLEQKPNQPSVLSIRQVSMTFICVRVFSQPIKLCLYGGCIIK